MRVHVLLGLVLALGLVSGCAPVQSVVGDPYPNGPAGPLTALPEAAPPTAPPPAPFEVDKNVAYVVRSALTQETQLAPVSQHVGVHVRKGVVTLSGEVPSTLDRKTIVDRISKLPGVDHVDDQLAVNEVPVP